MTKKSMPSALEPMVYGTVTVGDRGQVVIPKGMRDSMGVGAGDKLIAVRMHGNGIVLIKTAVLKELAKNLFNKME